MSPVTALVPSGTLSVFGSALSAKRRIPGLRPRMPSARRLLARANFRAGANEQRERDERGRVNASFQGRFPLGGRNRGRHQAKFRTA